MNAFTTRLLISYAAAILMVSGSGSPRDVSGCQQTTRPASSPESSRIVDLDDLPTHHVRCCPNLNPDREQQAQEMP